MYPTSTIETFQVLSDAVLVRTAPEDRFDLQIRIRDGNVEDVVRREYTLALSICESSILRPLITLRFRTRAKGQRILPLHFRVQVPSTIVVDDASFWCALRALRRGSRCMSKNPVSTTPVGTGFRHRVKVLVNFPP